MPRRYFFTFRHRTRLVEFSRAGSPRGLCLKDAQEAFQRRFGYWPGNPISERSEDMPKFPDY